MNIRQMETFVKTADAGSFLKASEALYISPNAIAKQINTMERELRFKLFSRSHAGLILTQAGESFYQDVKYLLQYYRETVVRAKNADQAEQNVIHVGTSAMTPSKILLEIWPKVYALCPDLKFQLVPFENKPETAADILAHLGTGIDVVMGILGDDGKDGSGWPCRSQTLFSEPFCVGVSVMHPLARKNVLTMQDLEGEKLLILKEEERSFPSMNRLRESIMCDFPKIQIEDFDFYDIGIFNHCETTRDLLLTVKSWDNIHPLIKIIPVQWNFEVPFGILHANHPSDQVRAFLHAVAQVYSAEPLF